MVVKIYHFTDNVVGKLVIDKLLHILYHLVDQPTLLLKTTGLETCLHHTTPLLVLSDLKGVCDHRLIDRFFMLLLSEDFETSLDDMVAMDIH